MHAVAGERESIIIRNGGKLTEEYYSYCLLSAHVAIRAFPPPPERWLIEII